MATACCVAHRLRGADRQSQRKRPDESKTVRIRDVRPQLEAQSETFSILVTSDAYAIYRVADSALSPSATRLLQHRLFERFGNGADLGEVKIEHLVVTGLAVRVARTALLGAFLGIPGAIIGTRPIPREQHFVGRRARLRVGWCYVRVPARLVFRARKSPPRQRHRRLHRDGDPRQACLHANSGAARGKGWIVVDLRSRAGHQGSRCVRCRPCHRTSRRRLRCAVRETTNGSDGLFHGGTDRLG